MGRKPRDPYARRKNLLQDTDKVMKGIEIEEHEVPTEMLIKPLSVGDKVIIAIKLVVAIVGLLFLGFVMYVVFYALVS